jgi:cysteine desulfurase
MSKLIYFDHAAATPVDPQVFTAMQPYFSEVYGNPSSIYQFAQKARKAVDEAREVTAEILECTPHEILFTSGGTESNNFFIFGAARFGAKKGLHIITTKIEHDSVLKPLKYLEGMGFEVTYLDVDENGILNPADVSRAIRPDTIFVSIMYANNEIGTVQPIQEISKIIKTHRAKSKTLFPLFHTDACQAAPYLPLSAAVLGVDSMTLNGGKIYGPKGAGMLFVREGIDLDPLLFGGGQEYRRRAGTENVSAIVGFATALKLVQKNREAETARLLPLREKLIKGILENIPHTRLNGHADLRLPNNVNISFRGLEGEAILLRLDMIGVCASAGSACTSGSLEPTHVIRALGLGEEWTHSAVRFSLGHGSTEKDIDYVLDKLPGIIAELGQFSPFI